MIRTMRRIGVKSRTIAWCNIYKRVRLSRFLAGCFAASVMRVQGFPRMPPLRRMLAPHNTHHTIYASSLNSESTNANAKERVDDKEIAAATSTVHFSGGEIEFSWHDSIADIPAAAWDSCLPSGSKREDDETDSLQQHKRSPFLEHAWLHCLEESGCASEDTGWIPKHLSIRVHSKKVVQSDEQQKAGTTSGSTSSQQLSIDGCVPAYIKTHSKGEFIFDNAWADAAHRNGLEYYPKLLVGVPFTPVTGSRFLWHSRMWDVFSQEEMTMMNRVVGTFLQQSAVNGVPLNGDICSSVHINFCTDEEATKLAGPLETTPTNVKDLDNGKSSSDTAAEVEPSDSDDDDDGSFDSFQAVIRQLERDDTESFLRRVSIQYHWNNQNPLQNGRPFRDFADYLSCFRSKRRINIKRERAKAQEDVRIDAIHGADILEVEGLVDKMFEIYVSTVDKMYWGRQYLTLDFFHRLCQTSFINNMCLLCARPSLPNDGTKSNTDDYIKDKTIPTLRAEDVFAGTINVVKDGVFYGRYWGCLPDFEVKNLHFETCYWSAIEYCIDNGLSRMEPGAGGGDYKWSRGFDPQLVHSVHYLCDPWLRRAVYQFLESETEFNVALRKHLLERSSVVDRGYGEEKG